MVVQLRGRTIRLIDLASLPVLVAYTLGGLLALLVEPPGIVEAQLGPILGIAWSACLITGPIGSIASMPLPDQWAGTQLRIGASGLTLAALAPLTVCAISAYGYAAFFTVLSAGLSAATTVTLCIDVRQLGRIQRHAQECR